VCKNRSIAAIGIRIAAVLRLRGVRSINAS
jgi:hypothetical protein